MTLFLNHIPAAVCAATLLCFELCALGDLFLTVACQLDQTDGVEPDTATAQRAEAPGRAGADIEAGRPSSPSGRGASAHAMRVGQSLVRGLASALGYRQWQRYLALWAAPLAVYMLDDRAQTASAGGLPAQSSNKPRHQWHLELPASSSPTSALARRLECLYRCWSVDSSVCEELRIAETVVTQALVPVGCIGGVAD